MATYLTRTPSSGSHGTTWTISFWFKNTCATESQEQFLYMGGDNTSSNNMWIRLQGTDRNLYIRNRGGGANNTVLITNRKFRDTNAWYHIVYAFDGNNATQGDRVRLYVNGVRETSFSSETYPSQGQGFYIGATGDSMDIGRRTDGSGYNDMKLLLSHYHIIDGYAYDASYFGETDSTTGEWKIKTSPSVTYGTNGCFILKDGNSVTDQSGNGNNFTVGAGTLTKTEDNPSNVFCTLNPLFNSAGYFSGNTQSLSFSNGNTYAGKVTHGSYFGTLGVSSGKYYWEVKVEDTNTAIGIIAMKPNGGVAYAYDDATVNAYYPYGADIYTNGSSAGGGGQYDNTSNKIYSFALDATNNKLWIGRDGTFTGDPVAGTGATWSSLPTGHDWTVFCHPMATTQNNNTSFNFGNGYFGTTAVSSAGTNASGNGIFEYDVPTGYTALSTKGLNL